jgi:predicted nucleotidyltransferase
VRGRGLAQATANRYAKFEEVEAVALSGSRTAEQDDVFSDIDLYVYTRAPLTLEQRAQLTADSPRAEVGNTFWEPGDEWRDLATAISLDVMFRDQRWIEEQLDRVLVHHQASVGYSTCFWFNVLHSEPLFDRSGWFRTLQARARTPYPNALKTAIIAKNLPILRSNMSSYVHQIELAIERKDQVSVNHRVTVLLASYFDILFAVNELPHPGEKRLVQYVEAHCSKQPQRMRQEVEALLSSLPRVDTTIVTLATQLVVNLEDLLLAEDRSPSQ